MDLSLRQLRSVLVLAQELNFTRAAERLGVPQQALSGQVHRIEERLGFAVFERSTRHVALTPSGERLVAAAQLALGALDRAVEAGRESERRGRNTLRVGYIEDVARELTEPILRTFHERHPDVSVQLVGCDYTDPSCGLLDSSVDVSFVRLPIATDALSFEPLFSEPLMLGVHASHPLADRTSVDMQQVVGLPLVVPATRDSAWRSFWTLEEFAHRAGRAPPSEPPAIVRTAAGEMQAVAAGSGCALIPSGAVRLHKTVGIVVIPIENGPASELALAWRTVDRNVLIVNFRDAVRVALTENAELVAMIGDRHLERVSESF